MRGRDHRSARDPFGANRRVRYLDYSDGLTVVHVYVKLIVDVKYLQFIVCDLYCNKTFFLFLKSNGVLKDV